MKNRKTRCKIYTECNPQQYAYDQPGTQCDRICSEIQSLPVFFPCSQYRQYNCCHSQTDYSDFHSSQEQIPDITHMQPVSFIKEILLSSFHCRHNRQLLLFPDQIIHHMFCHIHDMVYAHIQIFRHFIALIFFFIKPVITVSIYGQPYTKYQCCHHCTHHGRNRYNRC